MTPVQTTKVETAGLQEHSGNFKIQYWTLAVLLTAILVCWQLFVPPIIGLADQGDFQKLLGPLGYAPVSAGPEHKYWYLTRKFVKDPNYREPRFEQITSEMLIARAVVTVSRVFGHRTDFDLTTAGAIHFVLFLIAFARLLFVTRKLRAWWMAWILLIFVLTDVGYVAYWNSLYAEPASCIWFLFLLGECISFCTTKELTAGSFLRFNLFALLWISAKTQNAVLCLPLSVYSLRLAWRSSSTTIRTLAGVGVPAMVATGAVMYYSLLPAPKVVSLYDVVFYGILPESPDRRADLSALGLNPDYERYSGTLPWSPGTGVGDGALVNALETKVSPVRLVAFYLKRPARMVRHFARLFPSYFSLHPEFCGNFEASAGRRPGARSEAIAFWSHFHDRVLSRIGALLLVALGLLITGGLIRITFANQYSMSGNRWLELAVFISSCCLLSFLVAAFGDSYDNTRHQYLFNLLLDTCLVFSVVTGIDRLWAVHEHTVKTGTESELQCAGYSHSQRMRRGRQPGS